MSDYDTDIVRWSEHQADLLRRMGAGKRVNAPIDWETSQRRSRWWAEASGQNWRTALQRS